MQRPTAGLLALALSASVYAQSPPAGFTYETLVDGPLQSATAMAFAPDGRLFLTERETGNIRVFRNGALLATPWATVPTFGGGSYAEQGLLGIAIDPGFLQNHYVYVFHTAASGTENVIARLEDVGGQGVNYTVLTAPNRLASVTLHNGGPMLFGQDGTLFVATGDSYDLLTPQDPLKWNGKVLRFEVPNLTFPANNPFGSSPVYSIGHRNQFGLALHPVTGELFQTENGDALMDEVNRIVPGGNYGWPMIEGREITPNPATIDPMEWYQPTTALTGCEFYAGENYPAAYQNGWFVTDYNHNHLRVLTLDAIGQTVLSQAIFDTLPGSGYSIKMGPDGNLWYLTNDNGGYGADEIGRYVHQNEPRPSVHLMAVSNRSVGGAITVGVHANNNELVVPWLSWTHYSAPVATPFGNQWVPTDAVLPLSLVTADDRVYQGLPIINNSSVIGVSLYVQAATFAPSTGQIHLSNSGKHILRG